MTADDDAEVSGRRHVASALRNGRPHLAAQGLVEDEKTKVESCPNARDIRRVSEQQRPAEEARAHEHDRGIFLIPLQDRELKIARHGFEYRDPRMVPWPSLARDGRKEKETQGSKQGEKDELMTEVSVPETAMSIPCGGEKACRDMVREAFVGAGSGKELTERPFSRTRICWCCGQVCFNYVSHHLIPFLASISDRTPILILYKCRPDGNFLIDYHPDCFSLFLATGGSGRDFKFSPVIGEKAVDGH